MGCANLFPSINNMGHETRVAYRRGKAAINYASAPDYS